MIAAKQRQQNDNKQSHVFSAVLKETKKRSNIRRTISRTSVVTPLEAGENPKNSEKLVKKPSSNEIHLSSLLMYSTRINSFISSKICKFSRIIVVAIAACSLAVESSTDTQSLISAFHLIDMIIDIYFITFGFLKILSWYSKAQIKKLVYGKIETWDLLKYSGISDTLLSTLSLSSGHSYLGQWFRLFRLLTISTVSLQQLPHIDVLVSGITIGVKSLISTWLLLTLVFFVYAAWAFVLFGENDPSHFGSMAMSIWTLFQFSTMDNWSQILYVNMYGCDKYPPSDYIPATNSSVLSIFRYGHMILPVCSNPQARPVLASVIFISFILLCGFILVSLTVASVTSGINERLKNLEIEDEENQQGNAPPPPLPPPAAATAPGDDPSKTNKENTQQGQPPIPPPSLQEQATPQSSKSGKSALQSPPVPRLIHEVSTSRFDSQSTTQTGTRNLLTHREMLMMVLIQLWRKEELYVATTQPKRSLSLSSSSASSPSHLSTNAEIRKRNQSFKGGVQKTNRYFIYKIQSISLEIFACLLAFRDFDLRSMSIHMRALTNHPYYKYFLAVTIAFAALIEIISLERSEEDNALVILRILQLFLQIFFSFDVIFQIISHYPACESFFVQRWNQYDVILIIITWIPILATGLSIQKYLVLVRVLRILRLLRLLSWIPELNIIMRAISSSAVALFYVILLVFLFFFHFAIAGVFLFQKNDPQHFDTFYRAMVTLFQISTLDNWSDIARTNMYGCDFYGYDTGDLAYDSQCEEPHGLGWFASWYFALFIVFGVFVLISLFVGVIITSMELLREGIQEENEVWKKVKLMQKSHMLDDASIDNLLEIFNLVDTGQNGKLTFHELKPLLELVSISEVDQHQVFVMVDTDKSGQIDFSEFIQLVYHMGTRYKELRAANLNNPRRPDNKKRQQEPRRLSRAGEEYFALLEEDRQRLQAAGNQMNSPKISPHRIRSGQEGGGEFSDLGLIAGEGKSQEGGEEEDRRGGEGRREVEEHCDSDSNSSEDNATQGGAVIAPLSARKQRYAISSGSE